MTTEEKRRTLIYAELDLYRLSRRISNYMVLKEIVRWQNMSDKNIEKWYSKFFTEIKP
jgi:hypothetical protein